VDIFPGVSEPTTGGEVRTFGICANKQTNKRKVAAFNGNPPSRHPGWQRLSLLCCFRCVTQFIWHFDITIGSFLFRRGGISMKCTLPSVIFWCAWFWILFFQEILVPTGFLVSRLLGTSDRLHEHNLRRHKCSIPDFFQEAYICILVTVKEILSFYLINKTRTTFCRRIKHWKVALLSWFSRIQFELRRRRDQGGKKAGERETEQGGKTGRRKKKAWEK